MSARRIVAVAVDAAGAAGNRPYSYAVPEALADLAPARRCWSSSGAGRRSGSCSGLAPRSPASRRSRSSGRVRTDGPLLPELGMRLADWIATRYLAPPALTLRAMLPPGMLERLELVAERRPLDPS